MKKTKIIGITGTTGSGKSTLTKYLSQKNIPVIDADILAREVVSKGSVCLQCIVAVFGKDILNSDDTLNRKALARKAFSSKENTQKLNNIIHPFIIMTTLQQIDILRKKHSLILIDAPLLFECHMDILCQHTIAVICDKEIRKQRIMKRDNLTESEALARMSVQNDDIFYQNYADFIIDGGKTLEEVTAYADRIMEKLTER